MKKIVIRKKSAILKNSKKKFHGSKVKGIELAYKPVFGSKIITQLLQVKLDLFAVFL